MKKKIDEKLAQIKNMLYLCNEEINEVLDNEEYDIIMEHVVYGRSLKEISKMMKCNSNTLKSKYLRAINKLKEKGGDYFG